LQARQIQPELGDFQVGLRPAQIIAVSADFQLSQELVFGDRIPAPDVDFRDTPTAGKGQLLLDGRLIRPGNFNSRSMSPRCTW